MNADIIILTPISIEYEAVKSLLKTPIVRTHLTGDYTYLHAKVKAKKARYDIVVRKTDSGNVTISNEVHQLVRDFKPKVILLTGTAGGIKKVKIGDLVIGNKAYNYETGREKEDSFSARPEALLASPDLIELADKIAQEADWKKNLPHSEEINYYIKPIISGEKIIESVDNYLVKRIRQHYDDAIALEMEAAGFLQAMRAYPTIKVLNIRSISDLLGDKPVANKEGSRERAAQIAAAFTMELIRNLSIKKRRAAPVFLKNAAVGLLVAYLVFFFLGKPAVSTPSEGANPSTQTDLTTKDNEGGMQKQKTASLEVVTPLETEQKPQNPINELTETTNLLSGNEESSITPDTLAVKDNVASSPIEEDTDDLPAITVKHSIHVFEKYRKISGVQYEIDHQIRGRDPVNLNLTPGEHFIKLTYKDMEYSGTITVPDFNNHQIKIMLDEFTLIKAD